MLVSIRKTQQAPLLPPFVSEYPIFNVPAAQPEFVTVELLTAEVPCKFICHCVEVLDCIEAPVTLNAPPILKTSTWVKLNIFVEVEDVKL